MADRRPYGSGSLFRRGDAWYGQWRVDGRLVKRKLGPIRAPGSSNGLTRVQAERQLRALIQTTRVASSSARVTVTEAGAAYLKHLADVVGRKPTTLADYRYILDRHLCPFFGDRKIDRIEQQDVTAYMHSRRRNGLAPKTVLNHVNFLHGLFRFATRQGWLATNPVDGMDKPVVRTHTGEMRFLDALQLDQLLGALLPSKFAFVDRSLIVVAAHCGLRQGELLALRWKDVDLVNRLIRVRRSYTRGQFGDPKTRRSSRTVPMSEAARSELEKLHRFTAFGGPDDLVFAHPEIGGVLDASALRKRFRIALEAAGLPALRFHDLRHTYGTTMAAAGTPLRMLQEWMGHESHQTTLIYAAYAPDASHGIRFVDRAFGREA